MSFFIKAAIEALKAFPAVNARIDGNEIVFHNYLRYRRGRQHRARPDGPGRPRCRSAVVRRDRKGHRRLRDQGPRGDDRGRRPEGGTFTITNGGIFGSLLSTPIINPPQSGILGMHAIKKRPVVVDDQIVIRPDDVPGALLRPPLDRRPRGRQLSGARSRTASKTPSGCCSRFDVSGRVIAHRHVTNGRVGTQPTLLK